MAKISNILKYASSSTESFTWVYIIGIRYLFYILYLPSRLKTINFTRIDSNTPSIRIAARYYIGVSRLLNFFSQITHSEYVTCTIEAPKWMLLLYEGRPRPKKHPIRWFCILSRKRYEGALQASQIIQHWQRVMYILYFF